jgi:rsbT co-antagonist protein RsbR
MISAGHPDPRIASLRTTLADLLSASPAPFEPTTAGDELDDIIAAVGKVAAELNVARLAAEQQTQRLSDIMTMIGALVSLDYTQRVHVGDQDDVFNAIAIGLNILAEEMAATTVSKAHLDNMIASMADPLLVVTLQGRIETINPATTDLSGYPKEALVGQPLELLLPGFAIASAVQQGGLRDRELVFRTKDGRQIPVSLSASVMRQNHDVRGEITSLVCVARDLTESQRLAEERLQLHEAVQRQAIMLEELSTPIIPIARDVLIAPLVGSLDEKRAAHLMNVLLDAIVARSASTAIIDITGVRNVDRQAVEGILRAVQAVRLIGAHAMLTGIRPSVSKALVEIGADLSGVPTFGTLQDGVAFAVRRQSRP